MIEDEDIIKKVQQLPNEEYQGQEDEDDQEPTPKISHQEAANALKMLQTYLLQQPDTYQATDDDRKVINKLFKETEKHFTLSKKQQTFDSFFSRV